MRTPICRSRWTLTESVRLLQLEFVEGVLERHNACENDVGFVATAYTSLLMSE